MTDKEFSHKEEQLEKAILKLAQARKKIQELEKKAHGPIAVIGLAGRFPGANTVDEYFQNIMNGIESITYFDDTSLREAGVTEEQLTNPNYVKAKGIIEDYDLFDAPFFNFSRKQAELMDPQIRLFLETSWQAMEDAGYFSEDKAGKIGVFAGMGSFYNHISYLQSRLGSAKTFSELYQLITNNANDYLSTRISYQLNFTGPSITMQTACSTSLLAVIEACIHLLSHDCDMALAGGVALGVPMSMGYHTEEGSVLSPDGHCRPFDSNGNGTVLSNGVGVVVLKRYDDAVRDQDKIYAVIKGYGCNNDGANKVSYTAPSFEKQREVIEAAINLAAINPEQISLYEAHATATPIGDPIEIAAATKAYSKFTNKKNYCPIGSVKGNIGHLDSAAGIAAFIKTVLAIKHKKIPPTINFKKANPKLQLEESPFYIATEAKDWGDATSPRMAAVSAFGIGGSNAHIILSEAPALDPQQRPLQKNDVELKLTISAKTKEALEAYIEKYITFLNETQSSLTDVVYTINHHRPLFEYAVSVLAKTTEEAADKLRRKQFCDNESTVEVTTEAIGQRISLPGYPFQKKQYLLEIPIPRLQGEAVKAHPLLGEMHSLPNAWISFFGKLNLAELPYVRDHIVFGHCILPGTGFIEIMNAAGAFVLGNQSVCLSNISFEAALSLQAGKPVNIQLLMTPLNKDYEVAIYTQKDDQSWLCHARGVVSSASVNKQAAPLNIDEVKARCQKSRLNQQEFYEYINATGLTLGAHFQSIFALYEGEKEILGELKLSVSAEGYLAHPALLDGCLMDGCAPLSRRAIEEQSLDKGLYLPLGCEKVEFYAPLGEHIFSYAEETELTDTARTINIKIYNPQGKLLAALDGFHLRKTTASVLKNILQQEQNVDEWLYEWRWQQEPITATVPPKSLGHWLVLVNNHKAEPLVDVLTKRGATCRTISLSELPQSKQDFMALLKQESFSGILHMTGVGEPSSVNTNTIREAQVTGIKSLLHLCQALTELEGTLKIPLFLITENINTTNIAYSSMSGFHKTMMLECPALEIRHIDISPETKADSIFENIFSKNKEKVLSIKDNQRYLPKLAKLKKTILKKEGASFSNKIRSNNSYLITGGLGGLGVTVAKWLIEKGAKHLILTGRKNIDEGMQATINALQTGGIEISYETTDISDEKAVADLLNKLRHSNYPLKGIFHLAGLIADATLLEQDWPHFEKVFAPKLYGSFYLHQYSKDLDFFVMFSSIASTLGSPGQSNYAAANAFMDALCEYRKQQGLCAHSISWGPWSEVGMASALTSRLAKGGLMSFKPEEAMSALELALQQTPAHITIAHFHWANYLKQMVSKPSWLQDFIVEDGNEENLLSQLEAADKSKKLSILKNYVIDIVRQVLGVPASEPIDEKTGFFDMGLDSLMAVDFKNRLQKGIGDTIRLGATIVFDYSNIARLTDYLATKIGIDSKEIPAITAKKNEMEEQNALKEIEELSEEEAMRKLREELGDE